MAAKVTVKNGKMTIELDFTENGAVSSSGKSVVVASTHGNVKTDIVVNGKPVFVGVNAYVKV